MGNEIHCHCGKLLAKIDKDGTILLWCKKCKKEIRVLPQKTNNRAFEP